MPFRCARGLVASAFLAAGLRTSLLQAEGAPSSADPPPTLHPRGLNAVVEAAVREAHRRLGDGGCQQVFAEFRDGRERPLTVRLEEIGQTGRSYLGWIWFVGDETDGACG